MMTVLRRSAKGLVAAVMLTGCASNASFFSVVADQPDAMIYIDDRETTPGKAIVETWPAYGFARSYAVTVKRPGFKTLDTTVATELDWDRAGLYAGALVTFSLANIYLSSQGYGGTSGFWIGGAGLLASPLFFFTSNRFKPTYQLGPMQKEAQ